MGITALHDNLIMPASKLPPPSQPAAFFDAIAAAARESGKRGLPPVEKWNPPFCGDIDMRIARDGSWHYMGTPIGRPALVKLFASILRRDPERYVLVTPVERCGIAVADVPFMAVEMQVDGGGREQVLAFRTNVDDITIAGSSRLMRFEMDADGGIRPYVHVRGGLWARLTRALSHELMALGQEAESGGESQFGVYSSGVFFPIAPVSGLNS